MKENYIQRNVTAKSHTDRPEDKILLQGMPKVAGDRGRKRRSRRVRKQDWEKAEKVKGRGSIPIGWMVLLSVILTGMVGIAILAARSRVDIGSSKADSLVVETPAATPTIVDLNPINEDEALALVRKALAVRSPAEVENLMIAGSASPQQVVEFLAALEAGEGMLENLRWMPSMDANGLPLEMVTVIFKKEGRMRNRLALLTPDQDGKWRMDFEAFARWTDPAWKDILGEHSGPAIVRVFLAPDSYYNGNFKDDSQWLCLGLASPDVDQLMFGYCKIGSTQETAIQRLIQDARGPIRAVLKIQRPEGASSRQFEIVSVLAQNWIIGPVPFDQK